MRREARGVGICWRGRISVSEGGGKGRVGGRELGDEKEDPGCLVVYDYPFGIFSCFVLLFLSLISATCWSVNLH